MDRYFDDFIEPSLRNFDYSYSDWFNNMPLQKQLKIQNMDRSPEEMTKNKYGLSCKGEKQEVNGKTRAISNIPQQTKHLMGPVCAALEEIAAEHWPGYCGGKTWEETEAFYKKASDDGFEFTLQGDASAFDACQHNALKYIDRKIYNHLIDEGKIWHCDPNDFRTVACALTRTLEANTFEQGKMLKIGKAIVNGTVFSGSADTTLMNTLRMAIYNIYTLEQANFKINIDYRLLCKGDDFVIFLKHCYDYKQLYYTYWLPNTKIPATHAYGLGLVLKFLTFGDYEDIDFCSTVCIVDKKNNLFKIARKPDRMIPFNHYSRTALSMSKSELKTYYNELATSIELSAKNLPFYENYALGYRAQANAIQAQPSTPKTGLPPIVLPDDGHRKYLNKMQKLLVKYPNYDRSYIITLLERKSPVIIDPEVVYDFLLRKYGLTKMDIQEHKEMITSSFYYPIFDAAAYKIHQ